MNEIQIVLGGRTFGVRQLPIRADAAWREIAKPLVEPLAEMAMASGVSSPTPERLVKLAFTSNLLIDPMAVLNAVLAYCADLQAEREWIETNAYSHEALGALLALFFGMAAVKPSPPNGAAHPQPQTISQS